MAPSDRRRFLRLTDINEIKEAAECSVCCCAVCWHLTSAANLNSRLKPELYIRTVSLNQSASLYLPPFLSLKYILEMFLICSILSLHLWCYRCQLYLLDKCEILNVSVTFRDHSEHDLVCVCLGRGGLLFFFSFISLLLNSSVYLSLLRDKISGFLPFYLSIILKVLKLKYLIIDCINRLAPFITSMVLSENFIWVIWGFEFIIPSLK